MLTSLVKTRIKVQFATLFKGLRYNKRGKSLIAIIIILATLLSGYISLTCGFLFKSIILIFNACGRMGDFFSIIFFMYFVVSLLATCTIVNSQLYDSKDNHLLFAMPIPTNYILISRVSVVIMVDYIIDVLMLIPAVAVTIMYSDVSDVSIILFSLLFLVQPILIVSISMLIAAGIEWCKIKLNNDSIATIVLVVAIGCLVVTLIKLYYVILTSKNGIITSSVFGVLSIFLSLGNAIIKQNVVEIISVIAIHVIVFAGSFVLISRTMLYIIVHSQEKQRTRKGTKHREKSHSVKSALLVKEWRMFWSNPIIFFNTCIGYILLVVVTAIILIKGDLFIALYKEQLLEFHKLISLNDLTYIMLIFFVGLNTFSASSITLEGKSFWISKSMPVDQQYILNAKVKFSILIGIPILLIYCVACILRNLMTLKMGLFIFINSILMVAICSYIDILINIKFPVFDWVNITVAVKQSTATLLSMLVNILVAMIIIGSHILLSIVPLGYGVRCVMVAILLVTLIVLLYCLTKVTMKKKFISLD